MKTRQPLSVQAFAIYSGFFGLQSLFFAIPKLVEGDFGTGVRFAMKAVMYLAGYFFILNSRSRRTRSFLGVIGGLVLLSKVIASAQMYRLSLGTEALRVNQVVTAVLIGIALAAFLFSPKARDYYAGSEGEGSIREQEPSPGPSDLET